MKLYRLLIRLLYPKSFRHHYQGALEQAFRDQIRDKRPLGPFYLDILKSALRQQLEENMQTIAAGLFALAAAIFLGRFELHTDDTGVEVAFILLFSFILGFWQPKYAWFCSFIGVSIPIAEIIWGQPPIKKALMIGLVVMSISIAGSFCGVVARRLVSKRPAQ